MIYALRGGYPARLIYPAAHGVHSAFFSEAGSFTQRATVMYLCDELKMRGAHGG